MLFDVEVSDVKRLKSIYYIWTFLMVVLVLLFVYIVETCKSVDKHTHKTHVTKQYFIKFVYFYTLSQRLRLITVLLYQPTSEVSNC